MKLPIFFGKPKKPRLLKIRRVCGDSMLPALRHGKIVIIAPRKHIKPGDVVMFRHNGLEKVKRVQLVDGARIFVVGDNIAASTDSRHFGYINRRSVVGKVLWAG